MAENYTRLWEAFLGGEYEGADTSQDYFQQTRDFYGEVVGPSFFGEERGAEFGESQFAGYIASFDPKVMQQAEETFRSAIGDPYGADDPFSWEKLSRYDTAGGVDSRAQQLLESELYGQGKFLGGSAGGAYGLETSRALEDYGTGMRGESEALTHGALTSGAALASGTSGTTLRSGEGTAVAEDVLIEAYKKAKTLGSDYRAGTAVIETDLEEDLNKALTTYLDTIDDEKSRWYSDVMRNVSTFRTLDMGDVTDWTEEAIADKLDTSTGYEEWDCGYGQEWDGEKCVDTEAYTTEIAGTKFREDATCGIGEIYDEATGECVVREDLDLTEDAYGYLCPPDDQGLQECGECGKTMTTCDDGSTTCDPGTCLETDECGVYGGDDSSCADCAGVPNGNAIEDECGVCGGDGPQHSCWDGELVCEESDCSEETGGLECYSDADCGPCDRCDAGGCLPWPKAYAPAGCYEDDPSDEQGCPGEEIACPYGRIDGLSGTVCDVSFCNDEPVQTECQPCSSPYETQDPVTCECSDIWGGEEREYS